MIQLKNSEQIDGIRKSCKLLARLFEEVIPQVEAGMNTRQVDDLCVAFIQKNGGIPAWYSQNFDGAACISINDEVIHGVPSKKRIIKNGDIISLDVGIDLGGYISDAARTFPVGSISQEVATLIKVTEECFYAGFEACRVGNRIRDIGVAVSAVANKYGYGIVRDFCGHGVGLEVHEEPSIPNYPQSGVNPRIKAGMVLAIEPMINMGRHTVECLDDGWTIVTTDGSLSAHHENTVAVFEDKTEILSILP